MSTTQDNHAPPTHTAFAGQRLVARGAPWDVALAIRAVLRREPASDIIIFDDDTGRAVDLDLRGDDSQLEARLRSVYEAAADAKPRPPGRPKLGVVAREVTLLPRHWEWLAEQPRGASATLRKLVESARASSAGADRVRRSQTAADRYMAAMLGDHAGYEEASRALYACDRRRFNQITRPWPVDLRDHARRLAADAFRGSEDGRTAQKPVK